MGQPSLGATIPPSSMAGPLTTHSRGSRNRESSGYEPRAPKRPFPKQSRSRWPGGRATWRCCPLRDPPKPGTPLPQRGPLHCPCNVASEATAKSPYPSTHQSTSHAMSGNRHDLLCDVAQSACHATESGHSCRWRQAAGRALADASVTSGRGDTCRGVTAQVVGLQRESLCYPKGNSAVPG